MEFNHVSVLARACMDGLRVAPQGVYVDATTGGGGHSSLIARQLTTGRLICIDRDEDALSVARDRLSPWLDRITFIKSNFSELKDVLRGLELSAVDGVLFDLGVSSYQLDNAERGFSYQKDAPLDMRMDKRQALSAYDVVNGYEQDKLQRLIKEYGEERYAGRIASAIVRQRQQAPLRTTVELADLIRRAMPPAARKEHQHPAKRTFQAIRIEVNGELDAVRQAVSDAIDCLAPGGRVAVISFHSLEDRIVKQTFAQAARGCVCPKEFPVCVCGHKPKIKLVTRGIVTADEREMEQNPRARSAKLRVAERLPLQEED